MSAISVWVGVLPSAALRTFHLEVLPVEGAAAVVGLPEPVAAEEALVVLADPFSFPVEGFVAQAGALRPRLPVLGALAHGEAGPGSCRLWVDGRTVGRGAVGVAIGGAGARTFVSQGSRAVGPVMTVTAAEGHVVGELAGVPALEKVREVLSDLTPPDQALASAGLHLGIALDERAERQDYLVRTVVGTSAHGLVLADRVEVGQAVRLEVRDADAADIDLREAITATGVGLGSGAVLFTCRGRGPAFFGPSYGGASHDVDLVRTLLGADGVGGCFSAGEIGPVAGRSYLHGFTVSALVLP